MSTDDVLRSRLPDLRFVAVEAMVPHEQHDEERSGPLVRRLREMGMLRNPPIVAAFAPNDTRFVVLDGANRTTAARQAGLPHLLVQVVRYAEPEVRVGTWHHALIGVQPADLEGALSRIPGLEWHPADLMHAHAVLARREAIAFIALGPDRAVTLHGGNDLHRRNVVLNAVVESYRARATVHRVVGDSLADAQAEQPEVSALVVFPRFEAAEVLELATVGARLPAGITRHLVAWRALRVNVPLDRLADKKQPIEEKNEWLREWMHDKVRHRQVRFYQEPTVVFDE